MIDMPSNGPSFVFRRRSSLTELCFHSEPWWLLELLSTLQRLALHVRVQRHRRRPDDRLSRVNRR